MKFKQISQSFFRGNKILFMDLIPTWKCNARCITCNAWQLYKEMLSKEQTLNVLEHFKDLQFIVIEGGEVTLWPELEWTVEWLIQNRPKLEILIITNGIDYNYWVKAHARWKKTLGKEYLRVRYVVTINGIGGVHDQSRGVKNSFLKAWKSVLLFRENKNRVTLQYVPFKFNQDDYFKVFDLGESAGCLTIICYPSFATKFSSAKQLEPTDPDKFKNMYDHYIGQLSRWRGWGVEYLLDHAKTKKPMPCIGGRNFLSIRPNGTIKPCSMIDGYTMGQVYDSKIIWNYSEKNLKKDIPKVCQFVDGHVCCDYLPIMSIKLHPIRFLGWKLIKTILIFGSPLVNFIGWKMKRSLF